MDPTEQTTSNHDSTLPVAFRTPDRVETRIGTLDFTDGMPSLDTLGKVYEHLDLVHAFEAFVNALQGVSIHAMHRGHVEAGVGDNQFLLFSELMDAKSHILTANADTVNVTGFLDLSDGPMVLEVPPGLLGAVNDHWGGWVIDIGGAGPDRGVGGKYLLVPPGYDGALPEGGFYVAHPSTLLVLVFGRVFLKDGDPGSVDELLTGSMKAYRYQAGAVGTSFAAFLRGDALLGAVTPPPETLFHQAGGKPMSTIMPNDSSYYEWLDEVVQQEPAGSLDPELMGSIAAIGIRKGKPFTPDERMKAILSEAAAIGNATARSLFMRPRDPDSYSYPDSAWMQLSLCVRGYDFETPPPVIEGPVQDGVRRPEGVQIPPSTGYRDLDARTGLYYGGVGVSPAETMLLSGAGSQYLMATTDAGGRYMDGARTYKLTLPKDIPAKDFWSLTLYDNQTRSMLDTPQRYPRAGSQSYPSPAAEASADGSTTVFFAPAQPDGVGQGNWVQTVPAKGWFVMLRLYGPLEAFFDKTWRPGEIEAVG